MSRPTLPIIRLPRPDGRRVAEPLARSSLSADERARRADKPAIGIEIVNGIGLALQRHLPLALTAEVR